MNDDKSVTSSSRQHLYFELQTLSRYLENSELGGHYTLLAQHSSREQQPAAAAAVSVLIKTMETGKVSKHREAQMWGK